MLVCVLIASLTVFIDHLVLSHASLSAALSDMAQRCSELEEKYLRNQVDLTQRCSALEEKYSQGQANLAQVSASLDGTRSLNSSLNAQLDSERMAHEVNSLG
jgi:chromosome segregation ATPase